MNASTASWRLADAVRVLVVGAFLASLVYTVGASLRLFGTTLSAWAESVALTAVLFVLVVAIALDEFLDRRD